HEFRTPLNAILGFSEILSVEPYGPLGDVKYGQYVSNIFSSGQQMLSLVEDILEVAMIENGDVTIDMEYVDICAVMDECLEKFRKMARDKGVEVTVKALGAVPRIKADIRSVRQVYSNVLSNAIKYNKSGGKVNISLYATPSGGTARFLDTGTGISPVDIKGVMKPFVRGDDNPYRTEAGVRLGLSIVKSFIDMQGGELSIESTLHKVTTVIVTFPAEDIELETV
ncbi:MAG: HAMP domain-containing sensor histidine kinase, partial [Rhodospirillales bacterium]